MRYQSAILEPEIGYLLLVVMSLFWIIVGYLWGKKAKNLEGYMLAGRSVGFALGTATAMATWVTSNTTMLAPQFALQLGIWGMLAYSTASIGLFLFAPLAQRIKRLMPDGYTSGDFIRLRYGRKVWILFLAISIFYGITWLISMAMAGGLLLKALAGIPYEVGMTVILLVCVIYTLYGGMYAVIGTDFIQSLIILIGVAVIGFTVLSRVDISQIYADLQANRPALIAVMVPAAIMALFNNLLFGIGEIFHSNVWWSRAHAMAPGVGSRAYIAAGILWFPLPIAAGFIALASGLLKVNIVAPDMSGPLIASHILGYGGSILVFIVIFASLASSLDSLLAATSDLVTEDIYKKIIKPDASDEQVRKTAALIIILLGLFAWLVSLPKIGTLATVLFFAGPMVGSTIWPIAAGLYWKKSSAQAAFWAILAGSLVGLIAYFTLGWYTASLVATAVSMLLFFTLSFLRPDDFNWSKLQEK